MTSITDVPLKDIKNFLIANSIVILGNDQYDYEAELELILNGKATNYPDTVIDWIIAYNLFNDRKKIRTYSKNEIDSLSNEELNKLAAMLEIYNSNNTRDSIINVLRYLKKLDLTLVHPDIDPYIFQTVDEVKILSGNLKRILEVFKKNKTLRQFLYDNMKRIIEENLILYYRYEETGRIIYTDDSVNKLSDFVVELMKLKEMALAKETLRVSDNLLTHKHDRLIFISGIVNNVINTGDSSLIENYFKLQSYIEELFPDKAYGDHDILETYYDNMEGVETAKQYRDHMVPFFTAAIKAKNKYIINDLIATWIGERDYYEEDPGDKRFVDEIDALVKKAKLV